MKAIIWGSSGSLPSPLSSDSIFEKMKSVLWSAKDQDFDSPKAVESYLNALPHSARGTYKGNTPCVEIDADTDEVILCDAGSGIRDYALSLASDAPPRTYHIFLSHLHWDHIHGFPFFKPAYKAGNRIVIHGFHSDTEQAFRGQMEAPTFPVHFDQLDAAIEFDIREPGSDFQIADVTVKSIRQQHPGVSWGYSFTERGDKIVYSSDSEHGPEAMDPEYPFVDFFRDADVLIFDSQYTREEATNEKKNWGHSDHITAVELARRAKAKQLVIFHHEPSYSDIEIERARDDANKHLHAAQSESDSKEPYPLKLLVAHDGLIVPT